MADRIGKRLSDDWGFRVSNFTHLSDGFSFTVPTELDAYKAAHKYQRATRTTIRSAGKSWLVQVYI